MKTLFSLLSVALFIVCLANPLRADNYDDTPKRTDWQMRGYVQALFDTDPTVVSIATQFLQSQRPEYRNHFITPEVAQGLVTLLKAPGDRDTAYWAASILLDLGFGAKPYLPAFIATLKNSAVPGFARAAIALRLRHIDTDKSTLPALLSTLYDTSDNTPAAKERRITAACAISELQGLTSEDFLLLCAIAQGTQQNGIDSLLSTFRSFNISPPPTLTKLIALAKQTELPTTIRHYVMGLIAQKGDSVAKNALMDLINDSKMDVEGRTGALEALLTAGRRVTLTPTLIRLMNDHKLPQRVRGEAIIWLGMYHEKSLLPTLVKLLHEPEELTMEERSGGYVGLTVRTSAFYAIADMGDSATPYLPEMRDYFLQRTIYSQREMIGEFAKIPGGTKVLEKISQDEANGLELRGIAASTLLYTREKLPARLKRMIALLKTKAKGERETNEVWEQAQWARELNSAGDALKPFIPELMALIMDKETDSSITSSLVVTLRNMGHSLDSVLTMVTNIANDPHQAATLRWCVC